MIQIAALTLGINDPSARFRVRQHIPALQEKEILVEEFSAKIDYSSKLPGIMGRVKQRYIFPVSASWLGVKAISRINDIIKSNRFDAVWVNRIIVNPLFMEKFIRRPLIYDVDDAIWINNEKIIRRIAEKSEVIFAGNSFIAEWFGKINSNVHIIPTAVDTQRFFPAESKNGNSFKIVWTGSHQTIHYLLSIETALLKFMAERKDALLIIISDVFPNFKTLGPEKIRFIKWTPEAEVESIREANVGIMPLFDTSWEKGKCSFKMLQYMACGLPVLVSPVGMNNEVLSKGKIGLPAFKEDDWISGLTFFYNNLNESTKLGLQGREVINKYYSLNVVASLMAQIFRDL